MKSILVIALSLIVLAGGTSGSDAPAWEKANPVKPLPKMPLGIETSFEQLKSPPTPETVRLGRWLFFDNRLSADGTISCATCHQPQFGFSEPTPVSTGINGQKGGRKAPPIINLAWTIYPNFFWDGRAGSLEEQALGPVANPIEMGNTHDAMIGTLKGIRGYAKYFEEAFGSPEVTNEHVAKAIADYERTRLSGNSAYDRWQAKRFDDDFTGGILSEKAQKGHELFHNKAECNQCHLGQNFTDSLFHNLGVGWDAKSEKMADVGRFEVTKKPEDMGAFKTPCLREVTKHAPYMHDGSIKTLRGVVEHYNKGGIPNPHLSPKVRKLNLTDDEIDAIVEFMKSLDGEGYMDQAPAAFPQ